MRLMYSADDSLTLCYNAAFHLGVSVARHGEKTSGLNLGLAIL